MESFMGITRTSAAKRSFVDVERIEGPADNTRHTGVIEKAFAIMAISPGKICAVTPINGVMYVMQVEC